MISLIAFWLPLDDSLRLTAGSLVIALTFGLHSSWEKKPSPLGKALTSDRVSRLGKETKQFIASPAGDNTQIFRSTDDISVHNIPLNGPVPVAAPLENPTVKRVVAAYEDVTLRLHFR